MRPKRKESVSSLPFARRVLPGSGDRATSTGTASPSLTEPTPWGGRPEQPQPDWAGPRCASVCGGVPRPQGSPTRGGK